MKKIVISKFAFALVALCCFVALVIFEQAGKKTLSDELTFSNVPDLRTKINGEALLDPHTLPNDWMAAQRMYPYDRIKTESYLEAMKQAKELHDKSPVSRLNWEEAGPTNIGGRITDLEIHPDDIETIYIGGATGGILKSTDGGGEWINIFGNESVVSIGDIAIDPNNKDVVYAGTGEANSSSYSFIGNGIYKSVDAGINWEHTGLENSAYIARVIVDFSNSERIFVAACGNLFSTNDERGIYRSMDGGNSWERILYLTDSTAAIDLVQHPENPEILYAAMWERVRGRNYRRSFGNSSGIWKSVDGGDSWTELTNGLPTGNDVGRIGLAIAKSNPDVLYAFYDNQNYVAVFRTSDGGASWSETSHEPIQNINYGFGWYFGQIRVDPTDEDRFYVMGVEMYRSDNGGVSYMALAGYWNFDEIHVDHHAMWIDENTGRIFEGNDGGFYYSDDLGVNWTKIDNLPLTQFYAIDIDYNNPERIYGGTQDNNTIRTLTGNIDDWEAILGGDGMYCLVDYTDPTLLYAEYQWGVLFRSDNLGQYFDWIGVPAATDSRTNWSSPYVMHPEDHDILYFGTYRIWKTEEGGYGWSIISEDLTKGDDGSSFHTISTIDISKLNPEFIIAGSDDGLVHITLNDGNTWTNISDGLPDRWITRVKFDPFNENTIYTTVSGFRWDEPLPHVFKSVELGQNWMDISGNLPELPVNVIVCDPEFENRLFIGTDAGLFCTDDGGNYWYGISAGMCNIPVVDMKIHEPTLTLVVGTYGASAYRIELDDITNKTGPDIEKNSCGFINVAPNPFKEYTNINLEINNPGNVKVLVYDIKGTLIKTLFNDYRGTGKFQLRWEGTTGNGLLCENGIYLVTVETGNTVSKQKVVFFQ